MRCKADVRVKSVIDGAIMLSKHRGEHSFDEKRHLVKYMDYTEDAITRNSLFIKEHSMLVHRTGGITGDVFFENGADTIGIYQILRAPISFAVYTWEYYTKKEKDMFCIHVEFSLNKGGWTEEAKCVLDIMVND